MNKPCRNESSATAARLSLLALALLAVSGCGLLEQKRYYVESGEAPPLQVPDDLDRPGSDPSLQVPPANSDRLLAGAELQPPPLGASGPVGAGDLYGPASGDTRLLLPNAAVEAWELVGAALEESRTFQMLDRSREQLNFRVALPQPQLVDRRPLWRRAFGIGDPPAEVPAPEVIVGLQAVPQGTEVRVLDDAGRELSDGRAARVIAALDLRLKSVETRSAGG